MASLTSSLIVRLVDKASRPARNVSRNILGIEKASGRLSKMSFGDRLTGSLRRNNAALAEARGGLIDAVGAFYALRTAIAGPVQEAMAFESAMADVKKVVDFPEPDGLNKFRDSLLAMSKEIPVSVNGLAQIAAAAGQAGIAGDELIKFTDTAAKVGTAFDISADEAGTAMSKMMTGLDMTIEEVTLLTDAMNHLSNSQASTAAEILDVVRTTGAQAKQFGYSATEVSAFASAMIAAGSKSDVAATSFRNMGLALTKGESATKRQGAALDALGLNAVDVAKNMQKDAVGTTLDVMERLSKMPKDVQASLSNDLFGAEARALGPLLTNLDLVRKSLGLVAEEGDYAGSAFEEFVARSATFENSVQIFNNRLSALKITIGDALIPAINGMMDAIAPVIDRMADFAKAHPELIRNVMASVGALIAFKGALAGLKFVGLLGRGGALSLLSLGFNTIGKAAAGLYGAASASMALNTALAGMQGTKPGVISQIGAALRGLAGVTGLSAVGSAIGAVGSAIAAISAPVWIGIAAAVAAVGAAWKYWDRISAIVSGVARAVGDLLAPAFDAIREKLDFLSPLLRPVGDAFAFLGEKVSEAWQSVKDFFSGDLFGRENLTDEEFASIEDRAHKAATAVIDTIKNAFSEFMAWITGIPDRIIEAIGSIDLGEMIKWPEPPEWWKSLFGGDTPEPVEIPAPSVLSSPGSAGLSPEQQAAVRSLEAARASGPITTGKELNELYSSAGELKAEIAGIQSEIDALNPGPMADALKASMALEMGPLLQDLADVEAEIAEGEAQAVELTNALSVLSDTEATPDINTEAIDEALRKVRELSTTLSSMGGSEGGEGGDVQQVVAVDKRRARGGPVSAGDDVLVGEEGPEVVRFGRNGFVHTAQQTASMLRGLTQAAMPATGGGSMQFPSLEGALSSVSEAMRSMASPAPAMAPASPQFSVVGPLTGPITISSGENPSDVAEQVGRALEERLSRVLRGSYSDGG